MILVKHVLTLMLIYLLSAPKRYHKEIALDLCQMFLENF